MIEDTSREIEIITHDYCFQHEPGIHHPENSQRLYKIIDHLLSKNYSINREIKPATKDDILKIHTSQLFDNVKISEEKFTMFTMDTSSNEYTYKAAMIAAGAAIHAVKECSASKTLLAAVRPPGHHATQNSIMGFCYFNNAAIAVQTALDNGYQRVAIVDFDNHYGNGSADIFSNNPNVLYISSHADPRISFPGTGFLNEVGKGDGAGFNVAIPLGTRTNDNEILFIYENAVKPILMSFKPEILIVSAGFDGYFDDPIGILGFTEKTFTYFGSFIGTVASDLRIPVVNLLEGGYNIEKQPYLVENYISGLTKKNSYTVENIETTQRILDLFTGIRMIHDKYWEF